MMKSAILATVLAVTSTVEAAADWNYDQDGADWNTDVNFPSCGLSEQSPVNINIDQLMYVSGIELEFDYSRTPHTNHVFSNGHGIQMQLRGSPFEQFVQYNGNNYTAEQLHFHWGSENTINGEQFPLEMHIVHWNHNSHTSLTDALGNENGVLVVGVMFSDSGESSLSFDSILGSLLRERNLTKFEVEEGVPVETFDLGQLLPETMDEFFTFPGSLTTPPCTEKVSWVVMKDPILITPKQMTAFTKFPIFGTTEATNFRPPQQLNCRTISCSWEDCGGVPLSPSPSCFPEVDEDDSSAYQSSPAGLVAVLSMALAFFSW